MHDSISSSCSTQVCDTNYAIIGTTSLNVA
nr:MAG TPA: hypothetical protein [Caudoviricetes sp.]